MAGTRFVTELAAALRRRPDAVAYAELAEGVREAVRDGRLVSGERLPAERILAEALGVSRATVTAAFDLLRGEGYLVSRRGSGTAVAPPASGPDRPDEPTGHLAPGADIDLTIAAVPAPSAVSDAAAVAVARLPALLAGAGLHPLGLPDLRAGIARRYSAHGLPTTPDQVLVTQGALHGWDLVLRAFTTPGDAVAIEQPTYASHVDGSRAHHVRLRPYAVDAEHRELPRPVTARERPTVVVHATPDFHNPTGHCADDADRRALVRAARGSVLVVDETFAELGYECSGGRPTPTAAFGGDVVTVGSLSKLVWAGLRIGWIRADAATITRLAVSRTSQDIAAPVLDQLVAAALLGELDAIAADRRAVLRRRRDHVVPLVRAAGWSVVPPSGGMCLWVDLGSTSSTDLARAARPLGVRVSPGTRFSATSTHDRFLRLPLVHPEPVLTTAVERLVRAAAAPRASRARPVARWTA